MESILRRLRPDTENLPAWFLEELKQLAPRCAGLPAEEQHALARQVLSPRARAYLRALAVRARVGYRLLTGGVQAR